MSPFVSFWGLPPSRQSSFTRAAEELKLTAPAVSMQIKEFEAFRYFILECGEAFLAQHFSALQSLRV